MILAYWAFSSTMDQKAGSLKARCKVEKLHRPSPSTPHTASSLLDRRNQATPAIPPIRRATHPKLITGLPLPVIGAWGHVKTALNVIDKTPIAAATLIAIHSPVSS